MDNGTTPLPLRMLADLCKKYDASNSSDEAAEVGGTDEPRSVIVEERDEATNVDMPGIIIEEILTKEQNAYIEVRVLLWWMAQRAHILIDTRHITVYSRVLQAHTTRWIQ